MEGKYDGIPRDKEEEASSSSCLSSSFSASNSQYGNCRESRKSVWATSSVAVGEMDQAQFLAWQNRFRNADQDQAHGVLDSQPRYGVQQVANFTDSKPKNTLPDEQEFQALMASGPIPARLLQGISSQYESPYGAFSEPQFMHRASFYPSPAYTSPATTDVGPAAQGPAAHGDDTHRRARDETEQAKAPKKKARKTKAPKTTKKANNQEDGSDDNEEEDVASKKNPWKDADASQLIAFRLEMHEEIERNSKKQGMNTWDKLLARMITACDGFNKTAEACRKKWKAIYAQYQSDKCLLQISGEGRKITCRFFEEIDIGFHNRSNVKKYVHGDAAGSSNPCPPDKEVESPGCGEEPAAKGGDQGNADRDLSPVGSKAPKKTNGPVTQNYMAEMVVVYTLA